MKKGQKPASLRAIIHRLSLRLPEIKPLNSIRWINLSQSLDLRLIADENRRKQVRQTRVLATSLKCDDGWVGTAL